MRSKSLKTRHISSNEAYGRGSVAFEPGYNVGISVGNFPFTAIRTTSNTTSVLPTTPFVKLLGVNTQYPYRSIDEVCISPVLLTFVVVAQSGREAAFVVPPESKMPTGTGDTSPSVSVYPEYKSPSYHRKTAYYLSISGSFRPFKAVP